MMSQMPTTDLLESQRNSPDVDGTANRERKLSGAKISDDARDTYLLAKSGELLWP